MNLIQIKAVITGFLTGSLDASSAAAALKMEITNVHTDAIVINTEASPHLLEVIEEEDCVVHQQDLTDEQSAALQEAGLEVV